MWDHNGLMRNAFMNNAGKLDAPAGHRIQARTSYPHLERARRFVMRRGT